MTRTFLIATVAALAITAPAQAQRGDRSNDNEQAQAAEADSRKAARAERRAKASQQASGQRAARQQQVSGQRAARQQQVSDRRGARQQQVSGQRAARQQQVSNRRSATQQQVSDRRAARQQAVSDRRGSRQQAVSDRRGAMQQQVSDRRAARQQAVSDRRSRTQQAVSDRRSTRQQAVSDRRSSRVDNRERISAQRAQRDARQSVQRLRQQERQAVRVDGQRLRRENRDDLRNARQQQRALQRSGQIQVQDFQRQQAWQTYAGRFERFDDDDRGDWRRERRQRTILASIGQRVNPDWYGDYAPVRYYQSFYGYQPDNYYRYDYDDGYLYRLNSGNFVTGLFPILGGAFSVGNQMPFYQTSYYNVPMGYRTMYYDTPDYYYRYGDGGIYQVDPTTQLIQGIMALLTGQNFGIGQQLPMGFDAYNVPYGYRDAYYDSDDMWYRYDDGYIYGVDPRSRLIQSSYPVYGGYAVGNPWPSYAGYDYNVPSYYDDLYYDQPGYDYRYANNGIYQVDPSTQLVAALLALVTGQNLGVGQRMPLGYDAYNVPFAFRDRYYDTDQYNYRYADGYIYQVDPQTQLIRSVIDAIV